MTTHTRRAKKRIQKTVASVTHTADTTDVIEAFKSEVALINQLATEGHAAIAQRDINDNALRLAETRRVETLRKVIARRANNLLMTGHQRVGIVPLSKRLAEGYDYVYLPIVGADGMADEAQGDVWRKAVGNG